MASHAWLRNMLIRPSMCRRPAAVWHAQPAQLFSQRAFRSLAPSRVLVKATLQAERQAEQPTATHGFADLGLSPSLQKALAEAQITEPTEIQVLCLHDPPLRNPSTAFRPMRRKGGWWVVSAASETSF